MKLHGFSNQTIKHINQRQIISLLCKIKSINQVDIGRQLKISLPTTIANVNDLVDVGILKKNGVGVSRGGRKPIIVEINKNYKYILGIDFLVDKIKIILFNFIMEPIAIKDIESSRFIKFNDIMIEFVGIINSFLSSNNIIISDLLGIGVSIPGIVNSESENIEVAPTLHIVNAELKKYSNLFGIPIYFENEANAACYAEWQIGAAKGSKNVIYFSIMRGVGSGLIINDTLYRGEFFKAGEIGHIIVEKNGRLCSCGDKGCLNEYISIDSIYNEYKARTGKVIDDMDHFMQIVEDGDIIAKKIWNDYIMYFTYGIRIATMVIDPEVIIIGGEIANYSELLLPEIQKQIKQSKSHVISKTNKIKASLLKEKASIIGVALYLRNQFIENYIPNIR